MDILLKNAFFATFFFAHRAPERPQSNLYLKTFVFREYKGLGVPGAQKMSISGRILAVLDGLAMDILLFFCNFPGF